MNLVTILYWLNLEGMATRANFYFLPRASAEVEAFFALWAIEGPIMLFLTILGNFCRAVVIFLNFNNIHFYLFYLFLFKVFFFSKLLRDEDN